MPPIELVVTGLVALLVGAAIAAAILAPRRRQAAADAERIVRDARAEADSLTKSAALEAERKAAERRDAFDKEVAETLAEIKQSQNRLAKREDNLDRKMEDLGVREQGLDARARELDNRDRGLDERESAIDGLRDDLSRRLSEVAKMTTEEAREAFMAEVRVEAEHDAAALTREVIEEAEQKALERSREITLQAIQRFAAEHVADSTVRSIKIPSDDMKGRIIGREGRNIRAIEKATGADILVDDTPGVISVSCFDRVRQAIAAESLQKLVADGRVHPSRIEEIVEQTRRDISERIVKHGNEAVLEANIRGLNPKIVEAMGKLHFRTSYGQNVLRHSMEVAYLSQIIADQLGLDGQIARRCGFLHDIGKAMDHEMEGGHPAIGMEFARKHGEKSEAVLNAIGGHHGDIAATTPYTPIVMAADAVSGARPGARRESMELYIKRLEQLEGIAMEQPFVDEAHAIQAGREVRVIVDAKKADDVQTFAIATAIAKRVEEEMTFPGEIKVTVLREVRAEATAR
ncbi:MAG: ribonuclease Y [Phycisphaerales bacterium]|nr:ribonuclease Y [Planctomycetota bacterium]